MPLVDALRALIQDELQRQGLAGLLVWYDPNGTLASVVDGAIPEGVDLLRSKGSYLALRLNLEGQDPQFQRRWVVYIPEAPPPQSWLRDWELLGARWELDLLELAHRAYDLPITPQLVTLLRDEPRNGSDLARAWDGYVDEAKVTRTALENALLAIAFSLPEWQESHAILAFLNGPVGRPQLERRGLWKALKRRIADAFGWRDVPESELALKERLEAALLLAELVLAMPSLSSPFEKVLSVAGKRDYAASLAGLWRQWDDYRESYVRAARRVEQEFELGNLLYVSEPLLHVETLPVVDDVWRHEVLGAVAPDGSNFGEKAGRLGEIAETRAQLFWARQERDRYWECLALAACLCQGCQSAMAEAEHLGRFDEFTARYIAGDGWWQLDKWALELAAIAEQLQPDERVRFAQPAWLAYAKYVDAVNTRFVETVHQQGWRPTQPDFWQHVETSAERTAVILVDALRYDLGRHLASSLSADEFKTSVDARVSVLPSITELGMSALLPDAQHGLRLAVQDGATCVYLGDREVTSVQVRRGLLEEHLGERGRVVRLGDLAGTDLSDVNALAVLSTEVDAFGTFAADLQPRGLLEMVEKVARGVRHLCKQGFTHVLVAADHGFLFLPPETKAVTIPCPVAKVRKHRFAVGANPKGCLVKTAEDLGLQGVEILAFPMGLAVFALPGATPSFLHGGVSLQECVLPIVDVRAETVAHKVGVTMRVPRVFTSRIALIRVAVQQATLFDLPRRVLVEIDGKRSQRKEVGPQEDKQEATLRVSWLAFDDVPPTEATVRLLDADTLQVLEERKVVVEMLV